jgi:hypothetical protein
MTRCPEWLNEHGRKFYKAHLKDLPPNTDLDGYAVFCDLYGRWRETDPNADTKQAIRYIALAKQVMSLMKVYGLVPSKAPSTPKQPEKETPNEFNDL